MVPSSPLAPPSWSQLLDVAAATQWWNARRPIYDPIRLSHQALLSLVGIVVRQGQALLTTEAELDNSCSCQEWPEAIGLAWDMAMQGAVHATLAARQPDGTPAPSGGLISARLAQDAWDGLQESADTDVATALLRLEAIYAQARHRLFAGFRSPEVTVLAACLVELTWALGGLVWALERRAAWFAGGVAAVNR